MPGRLSQDLLQVSLPNEIVIDVGWTHRFDPKGLFLITIFRGDWGNEVQPAFTMESPFSVAFAIKDLVEKFLNPPPVGPVNESGYSLVEYSSAAGSKWTLA
jgi:hypothetical protein